MVNVIKVSIMSILVIVLLLPNIVMADNVFPESKKPTFDYFIMSFCPFSNQVEGVLNEIYPELSKYVKFKPNYVIYSGGSANSCIETNKGKVCALHGLAELNQNVREVCVKQKYGLKKYYKFVTSVNDRCTLDNVDTCWKDVAKDAGINVKKIEKCAKKRSISILKKELKKTQTAGVLGSPTMFINGKEYDGSRTAESIKNALCSAIKGKKPTTCV